MEEDIFIKITNGKNISIVFPNFKNPIKYVSLNETCTLNFDENFNSQFFEKTNRDGLILKYSKEDISFEIWPMNSFVNVNLDLKYFKIGFQKKGKIKMKNLNESISVELNPTSNKIPIRIYFYIKNNSIFDKGHNYFISRDLKEYFVGFYRLGHNIDLNDILNLKEFKIEIF